jgi:hypothetical protein
MILEHLTISWKFITRNNSESITGLNYCGLLGQQAAMWGGLRLVLASEWATWHASLVSRPWLWQEK